MLNMFGAKCVGVVIGLILLMSPISTSAIPVIAQIKTGETGFASREYIAIYNNSNRSVDITNWCIQYSSSTDVTKTNVVCITPPNETTKLTLNGYSYARFATTEFVQITLNFTPDASFSAGLAGTSGHLRLLDQTKQVIDMVGWGTAVSPEGSAVPVHASGQVLMRGTDLVNPQLMIDSNNNSSDFISASLSTIPASGVVEEQVVVDVCSNVDGIQNVLPDDYQLDEAGLCQQDQCDNIDGLQKAIPVGYESTDGENCQLIPIQLENSVIQITELLPNSTSTDTGNEYIELYNPNNRSVNLLGYRLELGPAYTKKYTFTDFLLSAFTYTSFSDLLTGITLPNSSASLRLISPAGDTVSQTDAYSEPDDDEAWALINEVWQYTTNPTPASANLPPSEDEEVVVVEVETLADCGPGRYRSAETNRCRNIPTGDQELTPCDADEVRNPETNRCKKIASGDNLVPCKEGQERNPETNRCRSILTVAATLKPCDPGEERNPETNRCRKVATLGTSTTADIQDIPAETNSSANWWIIAGLIGLAGGYAIYEWRPEIRQYLSRFRFLNKS